MNEGGKKRASSADKLVNVIIAVVIIAFVAVGVYATYGKVSEGIEEKAITNGEKDATVAYLAKQADMSVEDYLAQYGLSLGDSVKKKSTEAEMTDNMTIENYLKYSGMEQTADEIIADAGLTDKVTKDTLWKDFLPQVPISMMYDEETLNQIKTSMDLGDEVTSDMTYGDFEKLMQEKSEAAASATDAPADDTAATDAPETTPAGE
ncbi:MAG: hypothetical protein ACI4A5_03565 [Hominilimicola sp.]